MDFKKLTIFLRNLWTDSVTPTIQASWKRSDDRKDEIVKAIKEIPTEQTIKNTKDIVEPLLEAQNATTQAVKNIPVQVFPEVNFNSLEGKLEAVLKAVKELKLDVNIGETKLELKPVIEAIQKIKLEVPEMKEQEVVDYTLMFDEMMKIMERPKDHTEIKKIQELTKKLATTEDLTIIAQYLQQIIDKPLPEIQELPIKDGRILVSVDKVGGGGGGLTSIQEGIITDLNSKVATEETLQDVVAAIEGSTGVKSALAIDSYAYQAKTIADGYTYYFFEDGAGAWYIRRKDANNLHDFSHGTGGYESVYINSTTSPTGLTWGTYDENFDPIGGSTILSTDHFSFDVDGNLETVEKNSSLQATAAKQLPDNHQVTVSNINDTPLITGFATEAKQLPNDHDVTVSNMIPAVETGLAKDETLTDGTQVSKIIGSTGMLVDVIDDGAMRVVNQTYLQAIAEGYVAEHEVFSKIGYSPASTTARTTLWNLGTNYVFPTTGSQWEIVSTSAQDSSAGTGIRTIHLKYLDSSYVEHIEDITLNGVTPVLTTATNCFRVNTLHAVTTGSQGNAVGTITLRVAGGGTTYTQIAPTNARARNSVYTVPLGKTLYVQDALFSAAASSTGKKVRMTLHASMSPDGVVDTGGMMIFPFFEAMLVDSGIPYNKTSPLKFYEKTDIRVSVIGEAGAESTSEISGWLELN